MVHIKLSIRS